MRIWKTILLMVLFLFSVPITEALAFEALSIEANKDAYNWGEYGYYYEDKTGSLAVAEIGKLSASQFTRLKSNSYSFGFQHSTYWIRLEIKAAHKMKYATEIENIVNLLENKEREKALKALDKVERQVPGDSILASLRSKIGNL